jgi:hypothetical protein
MDAGSDLLTLPPSLVFDDAGSGAPAGNLFQAQIDMPRDNPSYCVVSSPHTPHIVLRGCD